MSYERALGRNRSAIPRANWFLIFPPFLIVALRVFYPCVCKNWRSICFGKREIKFVVNIALLKPFRCKWVVSDMCYKCSSAIFKISNTTLIASLYGPRAINNVVNLMFLSRYQFGLAFFRF